MSFLLFTITTRHMVKAFAYDPWMYYLGSIIDCLGYYAVTINRAMTSLCVSQHDLGKLMAFYSALESLAPIGVGFIYSTVWNVSYNFNLYLYLTLHITFFSWQIKTLLGQYFWYRLDFLFWLCWDPFMFHFLWKAKECKMSLMKELTIKMRSKKNQRTILQFGNMKLKRQVVYKKPQ